MCPPGFQGPAEDMADDAGGEGAASSKADPLTIPPPSPRKETFYADLSSVRTLFPRLFFFFVEFVNNYMIGRLGQG